MGKSITTSILSTHAQDGLPQFLVAAMVKPHSSGTCWLFFLSDNKVKVCPVLKSFPFSSNKYSLPTLLDVSPC